MAQWIASKSLRPVVWDRFPVGEGMDLHFNSFQGSTEEVAR